MQTKIENIFLEQSHFGLLENKSFATHQYITISKINFLTFNI